MSVFLRAQRACKRQDESCDTQACERYRIFTSVRTKGDELVFVVNKKVKDIAVKQGTVEEVESAIRGRFSTQGASWYDDELRMKIEAIQRTNEEIIDRYKSNLALAEQTLIEEENWREGKTAHHQ